MKLYIAIVTAAALVAPTTTLAYDLVFDSPKYYDEFVEKYEENPAPTAKLDVKVDLQNEEDISNSLSPQEDK